MMKKYIYTFIAIFIVSSIGVSVYEKINEKPISFKAKRLTCQGTTTTFEKIYNKKQIVNAQKLLQDGNVEFQSSIWKSKFAKSKLFDSISKERIDQLNKNISKQYILNTDTSDQKLTIKFYTRENDSKDPNKKSDSCKLYAGYLVYEFILNKKIIYKIQTDFTSFTGDDIEQRIQCVYKSFTSIK